MVLASISVGLGLSMSTRLLKGRLKDRRTFHEAISLTVLVAIAVHALSLLGDSYLRPTILDISLPFASTYETFWTSLGITAGWALAALGLSFYLRGRIGTARFKQIHRFTLLAWAAALVHSFGEGSDAGRTWFVALVLLSCAPALVALAIKFRPSHHSPNEFLEKRSSTKGRRNATAPQPAAS